MSSPTVQELYENYEIVNNKDEKDENKKTAYEKILLGVNGDEKEKRLSSQFIVKFFNQFPDLYELSFNKLLDLCEDDNVNIRKQVIQLLPTVGKSVADYIPKIADILIQMLMTDDNTEVSLLSTALNHVIALNTKCALEAIFTTLIEQLEEPNDPVNTTAYKYLAERFSTFTDIKPDVEAVVEANAPKLLSKLGGKEEFPLVVNIMSSLKSYSSLVGRQKLVNEICDQTKQLGKVTDVKALGTLILNCKQTAKLVSKNVNGDSLTLYVLDNLQNIIGLPLESAPVKLLDLLQCLVNLANCDNVGDPSKRTCFSGDEGLKGLQILFQSCVSRLPAMPDEVTETYVNELSADTDRLKEIECFLLALFYLARLRPEVITQDEEEFKQFRQRLQFLGRVNQTVQRKASEELAKLKVIERTLEENQEKILLPKLTQSIQSLVREFFKTPVSYKFVISPSWVVSASPAAESKPVAQSGASKRPASWNNKGGPAKYRAGPMRVNTNGNFRRRR